MYSFTQDSTQGGIDELNWTREPGTLSSNEEHRVNHTGNDVTAAAIKSNIDSLWILRYILWKDISAKKSFLFNYASARPHCEIILRYQSSFVLSSDLLGILFADWKGKCPFFKIFILLPLHIKDLSAWKSFICLSCVHERPLWNKNCLL